MKITLEQGDYGTYLIVAEDRRDLLVQVDYDFPSFAETFGWSLSDVDDNDCETGHSGTDGTVPCPDCGTSASTFICAAREWLDDNIGTEAEDPGYFDADE